MLHVASSAACGCCSADVQYTGLDIVHVAVAQHSAAFAHLAHVRFK
jgi:hypothetical protein